MADSGLYMEYGGDLVLTANGSVQLASGWDWTRQFFTRTLLTNPAGTDRAGNPIPADYVFHPTYGVGAGEYVGVNMTSSVQATLTQRVQQAVNSTPGTNPNIQPSVVLDQTGQHEFLMTVGIPLANQTTGTVVLGT